jgi:glycosyltransferase involved in cell wall biosynthesis
MLEAQTSTKLMKPKLSIIIGSQNARSSISNCLRALESQRNGEEVEILVVDNSTDDTPAIVSNQFPQIKLVRATRHKLMPELWEAGIQQSTGEFVALTTSHFVPASNWIKQILKAHEDPYPAIGGAIENDKASGLVTWAIYFCRYSPYMLPFGERTVEDFAGDNASYKRSALDRCREARRDGFWESFVHAEMRRQGLELLITPSIIVYHQKSFTFVGFVKQRFWHGRQFGSERAQKISGLKRTVYVLLSPLILPLYLYRITGRVVVKRKHIREYLMSLPVLILFLLSWSTGEMTGYAWPSAKEEVAHER